jgi:hypothetical protein
VAVSAKEASGGPSETLEAAILSAFPEANPKAPGLVSLLTMAGHLARVDHPAREIVISVESLGEAALLTGRSSTTRLSSSRWLAEVIDPPPAFVSSTTEQAAALRSEIERYHLAGYRIIASISVRQVVVPRALELAARTVRKKAYDQRHLLFALLEQPVGKWPEPGKLITAEDLARAREHIVEKTGETPEKGEDMAAWREILAGSSKSPTGKAPLSPQAIDRLRAQRDDPSADDSLGRAVFAQVIADHIVDVRKTQSHGFDRAFMVHLDGAWGSGKSSVLLQVERNLKERQPPWLVVTFNAWQAQHIEPAWWGVICQIVSQVKHQLRGWKRWRFNTVWLWWKLRNDFAPLVLAGILIGIGLLLLFGGPLMARLADAFPFVAAPLGALLGWLGTYLGGVGTLKDTVGALTTIGGLASLGRSLFFGSAATGSAIEKLRDDPYAPVMKLFERLVAVAERPILVIIDDLDRCNADFVVNLLENIQTMLRRQSITYLAAGDRNWLTTSFEKRYADFRASLGSPAKPLGHLFLEKVFQLSVGVPNLSEGLADRFWKGLVNRSETPVADLKPSEAQRTQARQLLAGEGSEEGFQRQIEEAVDPLLKSALFSEAALRVASSEFAGNLESRYAGYGQLLERNPRAIKRLVTRLALNLSVLFLEARRFTPGPLARWTILEMRWPLLADALRECPDWLDDHDAADPAFASLLKTEAREVLGSDQGAHERLDGAALKALLGIPLPGEKAANA